MKNCHNDHDSHLIRDWSEAHSGGGNRFFQVSTFISIATANINRLYEVFFQKTHLLRPLMEDMIDDVKDGRREDRSQKDGRTDGRTDISRNRLVHSTKKD